MVLIQIIKVEEFKFHNSKVDSIFLAKARSNNKHHLYQNKCQINIYNNKQIYLTIILIYYNKHPEHHNKQNNNHKLIYL